MQVQQIRLFDFNIIAKAAFARFVFRIDRSCREYTDEWSLVLLCCDCAVLLLRVVAFQIESLHERHVKTAFEKVCWTKDSRETDSKNIWIDLSKSSCGFATQHFSQTASSGSSQRAHSDRFTGLCSSIELSSFVVDRMCACALLFARRDSTAASLCVPSQMLACAVNSYLSLVVSASATHAASNML